MPMRSLLLLVVRLYGVPLAGLLGGALLAVALGGGDLAAALCSMLGCVAAVAVMRQRAELLERHILDGISVRPGGAG